MWSPARLVERKRLWPNQLLSPAFLAYCRAMVPSPPTTLGAGTDRDAEDTKTVESSSEDSGNQTDSDGYGKDRLSSFFGRQPTEAEATAHLPPKQQAEAAAAVAKAVAQRSAGQRQVEMAVAAELLR